MLQELLDGLVFLAYLVPSRHAAAVIAQNMSLTIIYTTALACAYYAVFSYLLLRRFSSNKEKLVERQQKAQASRLVGPLIRLPQGAILAVLVALAFLPYGVWGAFFVLMASGYSLRRQVALLASTSALSYSCYYAFLDLIEQWLMPVQHYIGLGMKVLVPIMILAAAFKYRNRIASWCCARLAGLVLCLFRPVPRALDRARAPVWGSRALKNFSPHCLFIVEKVAEEIRYGIRISLSLAITGK